MFLSGSDLEISGTCPGTYNGAGLGYLISRNYPLQYDDGDDCTWTVKSPENTGLFLHFSDFDTESMKDVLYVYEGTNDNGNLLDTFSGNSIPVDVLSDQNHLHFRFVSNFDTTRNGFKILLRTVSITGTYTSLVSIINFYY